LFYAGPNLKKEDIDFDLQNPDFMLLHRAVRQKMGTWWQVQKDRKKWDFTHTAKKAHSNPQYKRGPKFDPLS
jgi:hypothetical protein